MFRRIPKGEYGYMGKRRKQVILRTAVYFALSVAVFLIGYMTTGSKRNLLTVVAVLGLLPASKSLVNAVMFLRAKGCSEEIYRRFLKVTDRLFPIYDLYFTTYRKNYAVSCLVLYDKLLLGFSEDPEFDGSSCKEHLENMLKQAGHKGYTVNLSNNPDQYEKMCGNLNEEAQSKDPEESANDEVRILLYEISL